MYCLLNYIFIIFLMFSITLVYSKEAPSGFILAFLTIASAANLFASAYATWKYSKLEDHIKKLESKNKEDK